MSRAGKRKGSESKFKQTSMGQFFGKKPDKKKKSRMFFSSFLTRSSYNDTEEYRNEYPGKKDYLDLDDNYKFYTNEISSKPNGDFIDNIHRDWWGDYGLLERHHGYIQWLFPIRESGMNWHSQELQLHEIEKLKKSRKAMGRLLKSYEMMLDFYGMKLVNKTNGEIKRGDNWRDRSRHLNRSYHNYLRITRILKCLGEFGYEGLKANFVRFVMEEAIVKETLTNLLDSCMKFWVGVIRDDEERNDLLTYYNQLTEDKADNCDDSDDDSEEEENVKRKKGETKNDGEVKPERKSKTSGKTKGAAAQSDTDEEIDQSKLPDKERKTHDMSDSDDEEMNKDMNLLDDGDFYTQDSHETDSENQTVDTVEYSLQENGDNAIEDEKDSQVNENGTQLTEKADPIENTTVNDDSNMKTDEVNETEKTSDEYSEAEKASDEFIENGENEQKNIPDEKIENMDVQKSDMEEILYERKGTMADREESTKVYEESKSENIVSMETTDLSKTVKGEGTEELKDEMEVE